MNHPRFVAIVAGAALSAALALSACSGMGTTTVIDNTTRSVTVSATASLDTVPDLARIYVAVSTQAVDAAAAEQANTAAINDIIAALENAGVAEEKIQTQYVNLYPTYGEIAAQPAASTAKADAAAEEEVELEYGIIGYEMTTRLSVDGISVDAVGSTMSLAIGAGATSVDGPYFYTSNYDTLYQQALENAVVASKEKAAGAAGASGTAIGNVVSIVEGWQDSSLKYDGALAATYDAEETAENLTISPGEVKVSATVTVSYELI